MTGVFGGMAGALNVMFGGPIFYIPLTGAPRFIKSVFRETPITVTGPDGGDVLIVAPTWRVPKVLLSDAARGDQVEVSDGRRFKVLNQIPSGSPAADAFMLYQMEYLP
jgi:hypothetical protein